MKAVCALVCLALANGISANIFKRSHQPVDSLIVQPYDYINQYQQPLYKPREQSYQKYIRSQKRIRPVSESASHESSQESRENIYDEQKYVTVRTGSKGRVQKWDNPLYTTYMKYQGEELPTYKDAMYWNNNMQMPVASNIVTDKKNINLIFAEAQKAMKHPTAEEKVKFHEAFSVAVKSLNKDSELNATELLKKYEYPVEEHTVKTEDGYFLTLFRIPAKMQQIRDVTKKPVVFLMHGLLGSADDWLLMGPGKSLAYLLSDAGYDVWLGNARGNKYSRRHVSKHPALSDFWKFSNDEIALLDLPAMIDYVLDTTGMEKLHYIGHAQGTTAFFALAAAKPTYNNKIIMMHALSPMVYMNHVRSPLIRMMAPTSEFEEHLHHLLGHGSFEPTKELIWTVGGSMCETEIGCKNVCSNVNFVMSGVNIETLDPELTPVIMSHLPAGGSTRMIKHYGQGVVSDSFRKYDFGADINQKVYGSVQPPKYKMEAVEVPVSLYYSEEDWLAHPEDVERLQHELPHVTVANKVTDEHFTHMDFQFSTKALELVYKPLIDSIKTFSS